MAVIVAREEPLSERLHLLQRQNHLSQWHLRPPPQLLSAGAFPCREAPVDVIRLRLMCWHRLPAVPATVRCRLDPVGGRLPLSSGSTSPTKRSESAIGHEGASRGRARILRRTETARSQ